MRRPSANTVTALIVGVALGAGSLVGYNQVTSGASRASSADRYSQLQAAAAAGKKTVPYLGPFSHDPTKGRVCGPEVRLMEGALRLTTPPIRTAKAALCVGLATRKQLQAFQRRHGIPPSGTYGERTHVALAHAYSDQQRSDLIYIAGVRLKALRYSTISTVTAHAFAFQGRMVYCNFGSLSSCGSRWSWPAYPDVPRHTDCSGYVTWVYYQAGLPDPNGLGFTGGFTGSLVARGVAVRPGAPLHIGDLVFNGPSASNTTHVSIYIGHGLTSGHGRFGIQLHQWNYRTVVAIRRYF